MARSGRCRSSDRSISDRMSTLRRHRRIASCVDLHHVRWTRRAGWRCLVPPRSVRIRRRAQPGLRGSSPERRSGPSPRAPAISLCRSTADHLQTRCARRCRARSNVRRVRTAAGRPLRPRRRCGTVERRWRAMARAPTRMDR